MSADLRHDADDDIGPLTFLFTDIVSSTELWDRHPDEMAELLVAHDRAVESAIQANGGERVKHTGDGLMGVFPDSAPALRAAVDSQRSIGAIEGAGQARLSVRMGLHVGRTAKRRGDYFGTAPNRCARITAVAPGGQILVSSDVVAAVGDACQPYGIGFESIGEYALRGLSQPDTLHRVVAEGLPERLGPAVALGQLTQIPRPMTALIGREAELAATLQALEESSLVTLIGPGGVGKTRLAAHVALALREEGRRPVGYVDLLPDYPSTLERSVASALGGVRVGDQQPIDVVRRELADGPAVLVLDNAEHLVAALSEFAATIGSSCPDVSLLVTSQVPVSLPGERIVAVNPLGTEHGGPAAQLFVDRAREVVPDFDPSGHEATVRQLCASLDGLPLAVELAAARVRSLDPGEIVERLEHRLRFLRLPDGHPRARRGGGLGDVIAWSHDLLGDTEQLVFARLGVFRGAFSLRAAEDVVASSDVEAWQVADILDRLVERSLVTVDRGVENRYRLLESIRAFAAEQLAARDHDDTVRARHAARYLQTLDLLDVGDRDTTDAFDLDVDDVRAAVGWSILNRPGPTIELLLSAYRHLVKLGFQEDAQIWFQLAAAQDATSQRADRPLLLQRIGQLATATGHDLSGGRTALEEGLVLARRADDRERVVAIRLHLATMLSLYPVSLDLDAAEKHIRALEGLVPRGSLPFVEARLHGCGAMLHLYRRESDRAVDRARLAQDAARAAGIEALEINARTFEGANRAYAGDIDDGLALMEAAWEDAVAGGLDFVAATTAWMRGYASVLLADPVDADRWFRRELDSGRAEAHPAVRRSLEANRGVARLMLGDVGGARRIATGTIAINGTLLEPLLAYAHSDFDAADRAADAMLRRLYDVGDRNEYAAVAYWTGRFDNIAGRRSRAVDVLHAALDIAQREPRCPYYEVPVRAELSTLGEPGHLAEVTRLAESLPVRGLEARVWLARGVAAEPDEAEAYFATALEIADRYRLAVDRVEILVRRAQRRGQRGDGTGRDADRDAVRALLSGTDLAARWAHLTADT